MPTAAIAYTTEEVILFVQEDSNTLDTGFVQGSEDKLGMEEMEMEIVRPFCQIDMTHGWTLCRNIWNFV